jgi:hypothetical protein
MNFRSLKLSRLVTSLCAFCVLSSSAQVQAQTAMTVSMKAKAPVDLVLQWELSGFDAPESVLLDRQNAVLYVSSMNGKASDKDANAYISKLSVEGKVLEKKWISGLNAPKGMGIYEGKLYVADIDEILEFDIKTGEMAQRYRVPDALFLNDIAIDDRGDVYVSHTFGFSAIYKLAKGKVSLWLKDQKLNAPNGLWLAKDALYIATWGETTLGKLAKVTLTDKSIQDISGPIGNLDGIVKVADDFIVSDWVSGKVLFWSNQTKELTVVLDLPKGSADIAIDPTMQTVFVPQMEEGKVKAYTIRNAAQAKRPNPPLSLGTSHLQIPKAARAPILADYLNGAPNDAGVKIDTFLQRVPGDGVAATRATQAYLSYDENNFYAMFIATENPKDIRASVSRRDDNEGDDAVFLMLDTFNDKQRAYVLYANPHGSKADAKRTEGMEDDFDFDPQWSSEGQITATGYVVKIAIPLKSLRFHPSDTQKWGIAVGRIIAHNNEVVLWPLITKRINGTVKQFATVEIAAELTPGRNFTINPYMYSGKNRVMNPIAQTNPLGAQGLPRADWKSTQKTRLGLDAKFIVDDAFALDFTLNPDFSEVESDEPQVVVNQRYEVLFPEKRPFFLENAGYFKTPQTLFFSRRITDPNVGARFTGRHEQWSLGGLMMNDQGNGDGKNTDSKVVVARVQNDFSGASNMGLLATLRKSKEKTSAVADWDFRLGLNDQWTLTGQIAGSQTQRNNAASSSGYLAYLETLGTDRNFKYSGKYLAISPNFDKSLAYLPRTDLRQTIQTGSYLWNYTDLAWLQSSGPQLTLTATQNQQGVWQDRSADAALLIKGKGATELELHVTSAMENFLGKEFHKQGWNLSGYSRPLSWLRAEFKLGQTSAINYQPAVGTAPSLGDARSVSASFVMRPWSQWKFVQTFFWDDLKSKSADSLIYRNLVARTSAAYQFNRYLGARVIFDYNYLNPNAALTSLERGKQLNTDVQISYIINPGTSIYAGYAQRQQNLRMVGHPALLEPTVDLDLRTGRMLFIKLNYLWQL